MENILNWKIKFMGKKGQISVALILVMTVILGTIGLGADIAVLYFNWVILQKGVDAAALARAGYLQSDSESVSQAISMAVSYAEQDGIKSSELITDGSGNQAYVPGPNYNTITVTAKRTVPYAFFKLIGLSNGKVTATATAEMPEPAGCVNCTSSVATPGSQPSVIPGSICSAIGQCDVMPISLDSSTVYSSGHRSGSTCRAAEEAPTVQATGAHWRWAAAGAPTNAPTSRTATADHSR